jgi:hypothetical protein
MRSLRITLSIDSDLHDRLLTNAEEEGRSLSNYARRLLEGFVRAQIVGILSVSRRFILG